MKTSMGGRDEEREASETHFVKKKITMASTILSQFKNF